VTAPPIPEPWLRGPLAGVLPALIPAAHTFLQIGEEIERAVPGLASNQLWSEPGGAASVGFHLKHLAGSTDRLLTYARGSPLSEAQNAGLADEKLADRAATAESLLARALAVIGEAVDQIRNTPEAVLFEPREVGRLHLPSNVMGVLFHAASHAQRHAGQIVTTAKIVRVWSPRATDEP
jgi:DinB family protein